tara:strand:- start:1062 stop:1271 length:210 start_codon:yes stop_codon:yes gene_type:complete
MKNSLIKVYLGLKTVLLRSITVPRYKTKKEENKMKNFINKVKIRWTLAPWYIKLLDISCWSLLIVILIW